MSECFPKTRPPFEDSLLLLAFAIPALITAFVGKAQSRKKAAQRPCFHCAKLRRLSSTFAKFRNCKLDTSQKNQANAVDPVGTMIANLHPETKCFSADNKRGLE
jgi:hypothetical protein